MTFGTLITESDSNCDLIWPQSKFLKSRWRTYAILENIGFAYNSEFCKMMQNTWIKTIECEIFQTVATVSFGCSWGFYCKFSFLTKIKDYWRSRVVTLTCAYYESANIYQKRAIAVRVWRRLAKKSTANHILFENSCFAHRPPHPCLTPPSGRTSCDKPINVIYTLRKVHLIGYNSVADSCGSIFIHWTLLAPKSVKSREIPRKFEIIAVQCHLRSSILVYA